MSMAREYPVAQFNWGLLRDDWGTPAVAGFEDAVDRVNALADRSSGFVWRAPSDDLEAACRAELAHLGPVARLAATLSVWASAKALENFVHRTVHGAFLRRRAEWFTRQEGRTYVIWPIAVGHRPTVCEAIERLDLLGVNGPTSRAFDFGWLQRSAAAME